MTFTSFAENTRRRVASSFKRAAKSVLRSTARAIAQHPALKRILMRSLDVAPPLKRRLKSVLRGSNAKARGLLGSPAELSPAASNIYRHLARQWNQQQGD